MLVNYVFVNSVWYLRRISTDLNGGLCVHLDVDKRGLASRALSLALPRQCHGHRILTITNESWHQ